jgi:hypothetical protein
MGDRCPVDPHLADMTPDRLSKLVSEPRTPAEGGVQFLAEEHGRSESCRVRRRKKVGSWTLPATLRPCV